MKTMLAAVVLSATMSTALAGEWTYGSGTDPMGGTWKNANVVAENFMDLAFPYGRQSPMLVVQRHTRNGLVAVVEIESGQILCDDYSHQSIRVRFDDDKQFAVACGKPRDGSSNTVYLRDPQKILTGISKAKRMIVALEMYQNGTHYVTFDVAGFDAKRLK